MKTRVVIGCLGTILDQGTRSSRWTRWRPTVALCQHSEHPVDQLELLSPVSESALADRITADILEISPHTSVRHHPVTIDDPWDFESVYASLHQWARGYDFTPETHEYVVHITTGTHVFQICWFLLVESRHIPAVLVQTSPGAKGDAHAQGILRFIDLDLSRYDGLARRFDTESMESVDFLKSGIQTKNTAFNALIGQIELVATRSKEPILIIGPTGAGKSQLAARIFALKQDRNLVSGDFVEVNCATLRGDAAMSTLFGHVKGAYTGATTARPGLLKAAHQGVLFLDEIGELGLDEQAMLLRAIEEKTFLPVGSDRPTSSDFQLMAGTNRDLWAQVSAGTFREDLLARINLWTFQLPALRDRLEDLAPNLDYELDAWDRRSGKRVTMNRAARQAFLDFGHSPAALWNGNFRDLNAAMTRMATLAPGGRIDVETVQDEIDRLQRSWTDLQRCDDSDTLVALLGKEGVAGLDRFDVAQLMDVVEVCRRSRSLSEAGRTLFAVSRSRKAKPNDADRLRKYLARFGLDWARIAAL